MLVLHNYACLSAHLAPNIHVEAEVGSVQLLLHTANEKLALVHVEGVNAEVDLRDTEIHVQAR